MSLQQALLLPVFLHMLMTMGLGIASALARRKALLAGKVRMKDIVLDARGWPDEVRKLGNNYDNQFQLPMVWYAGIAFTLALGLVDGAAVAFAWAFFALRVAHSVVHVGSNILVRRFYIFVAGAVVLTLSWLWLAVKVFG